MPEQRPANEKARDPKRGRKRIWTFAGIALAPIVIATLLWKAGLWNFQSVDERLAAIEAARAIPDEENAATIYNQLLENYDASLFSPDFLDTETDYSTRQPWSSKKYPEVAEWLRKHEGTIATLVEASKTENCRFPISPYSQDQLSIHMNWMQAMRQWAVLLVRAGNNDMAEGRTDMALEKYRCVLQMANHLYQQPVIIDYLVGFAIEALALHNVADFVVQGDAADRYLEAVEAFPLQTKNNWREGSAIILEFERLYGEKQMTLLDRLRSFRWQDQLEKTVNRVHEFYLRALAERRGNRILAGLRRYRNRAARWPESLDEIRSSLAEEILIDPHNNGSFVYKLTDYGFKLHSKGKNNIDENGEYDYDWRENKAEPDDWPVWPPKTRKSKKENVNAEQ